MLSLLKTRLLILDHDPAQSFGAGSSGFPFPEVDQKLPRESDDHLLLAPRMRLGIEQDLSINVVLSRLLPALVMLRSAICSPLPLTPPLSPA